MPVSDNTEDLDRSRDANTIIQQVERVKNKFIFILKVVKEKSVEIRELRDRLLFSSVEYRHIQVQTEIGEIGFSSDSYSCNITDTELTIPICRTEDNLGDCSFKWSISTEEKSNLNLFQTSTGTHR